MNSSVNLDGQIINEKKATISINNRSFRYGDGCFETLKVINGKINLLEFHLGRLFSSIELLQFDTPTFFTPAYLSKAILDLTHANANQTLARIRLTIFAGDGGLYDSTNRNLHFLIQSWSLAETMNMPNQNGLVLGIYPNGFKAADGFSNVKSNNFLLYSMAALYAKQNHWNDALVLNHQGNVCDATIANVFIIQEKKIITPRLGDGPINGTMRRFLLEQLPALGYDISEESITPAMLFNASECFLSNAIYGIKWVKQYGEMQYESKHFYNIYRELISPLWKY